ncbi:MAG: ECF transporter S component [Chloroflexota bacterium]
MDKKLTNVLVFLGVVLAFFGVVMYVLGKGDAKEGALFNFSVDQATVGLRFLFVVIGLLIAFAVYFFTKENAAWEVGTRQVVWMAIGAALYAVFSWLFNGTVFVVPSASQVALRPAIAIPMFFGYAFGPVVGFFSGAVGNMFGDALTGFGLSPQWSIGNGLIGFIAGCWMLFKDRKQSMNTVLYVSGALVVLTALLYFMNRNQANMLFFDPANNVFGDATISIFAGLSIVVGFILVLAVRFGFASNENVATAVMWGMLGNILGLLFASLADIFINGLTLPATIVGQFLPAAGPNLIFAAILVPLLVGAYASVQRQSGR